jgi:hypothetical protein
MTLAAATRKLALLPKRTSGKRPALIQRKKGMVEKNQPATSGTAS